MVDFNPDKTVLINFSLKKKKSCPKVRFGDKLITQVHSQKHLGIILSEDMKWTLHINYIRSKAYKKIGWLLGKIMYLSVEQKSLFYKSSIRPIVEYASVIFDNCSIYNELDLDNVQ